MTTYAKPYKPAVDLIQHLRARGLAVPNPASAENFIDEVGFDRLRIYFLSRRNLQANGRPFTAGVTFDDIVDIYTFDENLRLLMFKYCSRVEIILKTIISEEICSMYGCDPYMDSRMYKDKDARSDMLKSISALSNKYLALDRRAKHYSDKYDDPAFPPLWMMREFMTFGSLNYFYGKLNQGIKQNINVKFGLGRSDILPRWISCFVDLRNVCAHHDRLFNRKFQKIPLRSQQHNAPRARDPHKVAALCHVMQVILNNRSPNCNIEQEVRALVVNHPAVTVAEIGF